MNMVIRRTLFVLMCLLASSLYMYGQIAVKTNVAMDAVAIPNLGVEVGLSKKLTLDVPMYYNPWKYSDSKMQRSLLWCSFDGRCLSYHRHRFAFFAF